MKVKNLEKKLAEFLELPKFNDYCPNGIQVEANENVKKIALGVSASMSLFKKAKAYGADTLIVHHGLFWKGNDLALKGVLGKRVQYLFNNKINLFGYHLPLDCHSKIGNNACIGDALKLSNRISFAKHGGQEIGVIGTLPSPLNMNIMVASLKKIFGQLNYIYSFGRKKIKKVAVVSGGAASDIFEAYEKKADLFITGEVSEPTEHWCKEAGINYIAAGHYISEKMGVKALGSLIQKEMNIECKFIDVPNKV